MIGLSGWLRLGVIAGEATQADRCNAMSFSIRGKAQTSLLAGRRFLLRAGRILGLRLAS